jgi:hypothetical protein
VGSWRVLVSYQLKCNTVTNLYGGGGALGGPPHPAQQLNSAGEAACSMNIRAGLQGNTAAAAAGAGAGASGAARARWHAAAAPRAPSPSARTPHAALGRSQPLTDSTTAPHTRRRRRRHAHQRTLTSAHTLCADAVAGGEGGAEGRGRGREGAGSSPSSNCTHSAWPPAQAMWSGVYFLPPCRHTPPPVEITGTVGKSQSLMLIKSLISSRRHRRRVHRGHGGAREHAGQVRRQTHPEQQQRARASISCQGGVDSCRHTGIQAHKIGYRYRHTHRWSPASSSAEGGAPPS